jgi:hypothetical protein
MFKHQIECHFIISILMLCFPKKWGQVCACVAINIVFKADKTDKIAKKIPSVKGDKKVNSVALRRVTALQFLPPGFHSTQ